MQSKPIPLIPAEASPAAKAELLLTSWLEESASPQAVQMLSPASKAQLLAIMEAVLTETADVNVDQQDVWTVLSGARCLQFGVATGSGHNRAETIGRELWAGATVLGDATLPAQRLLLSIQSGTAEELEMDELTFILEYVLNQAGDQAEVVFGHGISPTLGESIQVAMVVSRYAPPHTPTAVHATSLTHQ